MGWRFLVASLAPENSGWVATADRFDARFEPDFVDALFLPIGEQADAVGAGLDGVEMILHLTPANFHVNVLSARGRWAGDRATLVMTPSAPRPTTDPKNVSPSFCRESEMVSPEAETNSRADTAVDRFPFFSPEP